MKATSLAVSGTPSDHLAFWRMVNVQTRPSSLTVQSVARPVEFSPFIGESVLGSYPTSES